MSNFPNFKVEHSNQTFIRKRLNVKTPDINKITNTLTIWGLLPLWDGRKSIYFPGNEKEEKFSYWW